MRRKYRFYLTTTFLLLGCLLFGLFYFSTRSNLIFLTAVIAVVTAEVYTLFAPCKMDEESWEVINIPINYFREDFSEDSLYAITTRFCEERDIPSPSVRVNRDLPPNAFAYNYLGKNKVVFTRGVLMLLDNDEIEVIYAHELSHLSTPFLMMYVCVNLVGEKLKRVAERFYYVRKSFRAEKKYLETIGSALYFRAFSALSYMICLFGAPLKIALEYDADEYALRTLQEVQTKLSRAVAKIYMVEELVDSFSEEDIAKAYVLAIKEVRKKDPDSLVKYFTKSPSFKERFAYWLSGYPHPYDRLRNIQRFSNKYVK